MLAAVHRLAVAFVAAGAVGATAGADAGAVERCHLMEPGFNSAYRLCVDHGPRGGHGRFTFRGRTIPIASPTTAPAGHWAAGFLSHDGRTLLLQWIAECEVPVAFFVPARGGTPRVVTGERDWANAPASVAHGWTWRGNKAIVEVLPGCSERGASKVRLIAP
jgi:hypothetical protein